MYATEEIEYAQELLIVNREYPTGREEETHVATPCPEAYYVNQQKQLDNYLS